MNKNQAQDCFKKAEQFFNANKLDKSLKFFKKAKGLDESLEEKVEIWVKKIEKEKLKPSIKGGVIHHPKDSEEFSKILKGTKKLVVIDFFATWCRPCTMIAPSFKQFTQDYKDSAIFVKVDVDDKKLMSVCKKYKITSMPTFKFIKNETEVDELKGASDTYLKSKIESNL